MAAAAMDCASVRGLEAECGPRVASGAGRQVGGWRIGRGINEI